LRSSRAFKKIRKKNAIDCVHRESGGRVEKDFFRSISLVGGKRGGEEAGGYQGAEKFADKAAREVGSIDEGSVSVGGFGSFQGGTEKIGEGGECS